MPSFLSCEEAAKIAHCSELTIKRAVRSGALIAYKPGKGFAITPDDLTAWVKTRKVKPRAKKNGPA